MSAQTQEEMIADTYKARPDYKAKNGASIPTYLYSVVLNLRRKATRYQQKHARLYPVDSHPTGYDAVQDDFRFPTSQTPEEALGQVETMERLEQAIETLPANEQRIIRLALQGKTNGEIAQEVNLSRERVAQYKSRARKKLSKELQP